MFRLFSSIISGLVHYYVYRRICDVIEPAKRLRRILGAVFVLMFLSIPLQTSARMWAPALSAKLGWVSGPWLAFVGVSATYFAILDLIRLVAWGVTRIRKREPAATDVGRRQFLLRAGGGTALAVTSASVGLGVFEARGEHEIVTTDVPLKKLPKALDGFTIVQLTDLHVGMTIDREFVQRVVDRANALEPDLLVLTGDLIDGPVERLRDDVAPLGQLKAKHGVYAVTGNHEYYAGVDDWIAEISKLGVTYLRNQHVTIADGFTLAGVDDYSAHEYPGHGEDLDAATKDRNAAHPLVLLAHQPRQVRHASKYDVDLQLSGHTHGGQIWPWHYIVKVQQHGLLAGLYEHDATRVYVSRGCGYWGPPVRFGAPLEITRIVLRALPSAA